MSEIVRGTVLGISDDKARIRLNNQHKNANGLHVNVSVADAQVTRIGKRGRTAFTGEKTEDIPVPGTFVIVEMTRSKDSRGFKPKIWGMDRDQ